MKLAGACLFPAQVDEAMLRNIFNRFFFAIPSFSERYPDVVDVVRTLYFPPKGDGMFAFVEFVDDVITTTAVQMSGFELHNRAIRSPASRCVYARGELQ